VPELGTFWTTTVPPTELLIPPAVATVTKKLNVAGGAFRGVVNTRLKV
jgi:hypothetical protein